jgi:hypothetical protein
MLDLGANHHNIEQGAPAWFNLRRGRFTASEIHRLICSRSRLKKGELLSKGAKTFSRLKLGEIATGKRKENIETVDMRRGTELEPEARFKFECEHSLKVVTTGFFTFSDWLGCSTDGIVIAPNLAPKYRKSVLEIKCAGIEKHLHYCSCRNWKDIKEASPLLYWQLNCALFVTGLHRCWFVAYNPDVSAKYKHLKLFSLCLEADDKILCELADSLLRGYVYRNQLIKKLGL